MEKIDLGLMNKTEFNVKFSIGDESFIITAHSSDTVKVEKDNYICASVIDTKGICGDIFCSKIDEPIVVDCKLINKNELYLHYVRPF